MLEKGKQKSDAHNGCNLGIFTLGGQTKTSLFFDKITFKEIEDEGL